MRIGELARRAGLSTSAIRYYEEQGLLPPAERRAGQRVFDEPALTQLAVVQLAKEVGFTVAEIRALLADFAVHRWRRLAERKLVELRQRQVRIRVMTALLERLLECRCVDLDVCGRSLRRHHLLHRGSG